MRRSQFLPLARRRCLLGLTVHIVALYLNFTVEYGSDVDDDNSTETTLDVKELLDAAALQLF